MIDGLREEGFVWLIMDLSFVWLIFNGIKFYLKMEYFNTSCRIDLKYLELWAAFVFVLIMGLKSDF